MLRKAIYTYTSHYILRIFIFHIQFCWGDVVLRVLSVNILSECDDIGVREYRASQASISSTVYRPMLLSGESLPSMSPNPYPCPLFLFHIPCSTFMSCSLLFTDRRRLILCRSHCILFMHHTLICLHLERTSFEGN